MAVQQCTWKPIPNHENYARPGSSSASTPSWAKHPATGAPYCSRVKGTLRGTNHEEGHRD